MTSDFDLRGQAGQFPVTRRSALASIGSDDPVTAARAFELLVRGYWKPVYAHLRLRWARSPEDARDLTQEFFARALEKRQLTGFDPSKARFRTYLRGALDHFVLEADRAARRDKRGGALTRLSLDFDLVEAELARAGPRDATAIETCFETEWTRSLFGAALDAFEAQCRKDGKVPQLTVFRRYVIEPAVDSHASDAKPSYASIGAELSLSITDVTNYLAWARRTFRELVLDQLRALTATEEEFKSEARAVLGISP
jgi:DNA-directed RNA polymerase specialized sigma24 family protein